MTGGFSPSFGPCHSFEEDYSFVALYFFSVRKGIAIMRGFKTVKEARDELKKRHILYGQQLRATEAIDQEIRIDISAEG